MRAIIISLLLITFGGSVLAGKHPSVFIHDLVTSPGDLLTSDPNKGIAVPQPTPKSWRKKTRIAHNFEFYDDLTAQRVQASGLAESCGEIERIPGAKAYFVDLAEGSTPVRGPHWEGLPSYGTTVVKITVEPDDHAKLIYLRATNSIIWNIEGRPAGVFMFGPSYLGAAEPGVPVYSARHAKDCETSNGLPKEINAQLNEGRSKASIFNAHGKQGTKSVNILAELNAQAAELDRQLVATTSKAPIAVIHVQMRGRQFDL